MQPKTELIAEWLAKADDDLRMAGLALDASPPVSWGAAFHAEQAAEKLLKALLTFHSVEFTRSHDIDYLLSLCLAVEAKAESLRDTASKLTDFAVEPRYPLPRRDPTEAEARGAIQIARQVRRFVRDVLPSELSQAADEAR
jgi:HEPN domain-containing protein